jgi:predicted MarR family transcription regulator
MQYACVAHVVSDVESGREWVCIHVTRLGRRDTEREMDVRVKLFSDRDIRESCDGQPVSRVAG